MIDAFAFESVCKWMSDSQALEAQRQYERALASRTNTISGRVYGKDPTIFAWELANQPRCVDLHYCDDETLVRWAREMARALRDANVSQPIAWGGAGYDNRYGEDLLRIAADGEVDILTLHLYPGDSSGPEAAVREATRVTQTRPIWRSSKSAVLLLM